jgi:YgjP-like, metallopeptidase domain/HsdM N-terminal domain
VQVQDDPCRTDRETFGDVSGSSARITHTRFPFRGAGRGNTTINTVRKGVALALKKSDLYSSLWKSCDELRGGMDASQYKDYILTLLFVKYVSDNILVHEMTHYLERNHGERFTTLMDGFMPTWRSRRDRLNDSLLAAEHWAEDWNQSRYLSDTASPKGLSPHHISAIWVIAGRIEDDMRRVTFHEAVMKGLLVALQDWARLFGSHVFGTGSAVLGSQLGDLRLDPIRRDTTRP